MMLKMKASYFVQVENIVHLGGLLESLGNCKLCRKWLLVKEEIASCSYQTRLILKTFARVVATIVTLMPIPAI